MGKWSNFTDQEVERRRKASIAAIDDQERERFLVWYQQKCDTDYWREGQRCSGCDHWQSEGGSAGRCTAAAVVSGEQVLKSLGFSWATWAPAPGHPFTDSSFWCGKFKDDFDWSGLDDIYLHKIGAMKNGELLDKPAAPANKSPSTNPGEKQ